MSDAKTWIGPSDPKDQLDLAAIVASLPAEAIWLKTALGDSRIAGLFKQRRTASGEAAAAQRRFKIISLIAIVGTTVGTLASGLLLYGAGSDVPSGGAGPADQTLVGWVKDRRTFIAWTQIVGLFVAAAAAALLGSQNFIERWTEQRRQAELQRREIFTHLLELATKEVRKALPMADPANPVRQVLEFFRRYQLDLQISYYARSGARARSWAGVLGWITALLAAFAAITGAIGGLGTPAAAAISAFLGIAVPLFLSGAQSWRAAALDSDKAAAYDKAGKELEKARLDLSHYERSADAGDAADVKAFIDQVHLVMATENNAWVPAANVATGR
jgi:Protein of unknown function (DUF4231)